MPQPDTWNATAAEYRRGTNVPEVFRRQVARTPSLDAIRTLDGRRIRYHELDRASDYCAQLLGSHGVGPGTFVPVLLPRSPEMVLTMLAVSKSGAAIVGVDPEAPPARIAEIVNTVRAPLVIGCGLEQVETPIWVPPPVEQAAEKISNPPTPAISSDDPLCVFFTSGSTGKPKGAVIPHRALLRLLEGNPVNQLGPGVVRPHTSPIAWDVGSYEVWASVLTGGTAVPVADPYPSPALLRRMREAVDVNVIWLTTTVFNLFVDEDLDALDGLREVVTGGERLSPTHVAAFLDRHPTVPLINTYGPSECCTFTTLHRVRPEDPDLPDGIPLGAPVQNTAVHICDRGRICDIGEPGELCVAGDGVGLGYLDDPDRTARQFVDLEVDGRTTRVYRSGDLAYWADDGTVRYLGRMDRQVKIRGHRVEPLEVERLLLGLPGVAAAAAIPRVAADGLCRDLAAFYITTNGAPLSHELVHERLCRDLPGYTVPQLVRHVSSFPLTRNGKLDSEALLATVVHGAAPVGAACADSAASASSRQAGTRSQVEAAVDDVLAAVLGGSDKEAHMFDSDRSLFTVGATSLDLGRIAARLEARLGAVLPISWLADHPTRSAIIDRLDGQVEQQPSVPTAPSPVSLSATESAFWLEHQLNQSDLANSCLIGWDVTGPLDLEALARAAAAVHSRHEALHARYPAGEEPLAVLDGIGDPDVRRMVEQATPDAALTIVEAELLHPFDLDGGRVWRLVVAPVDESRALVGVAVHHIAFDGWSEHILAADLSACYRAAVTGQAQPPGATPSLATVAAERVRKLAALDLSDQHAYWIGALADVPRLRFPPQPRCGVNERDAGRSGIHLRIDGGWSAVINTARAAGTSPFVVLLSGYAAAVADSTGCPEFLIGYPISTRAGGAVDEAIGCLVETSCARVRPAGGSDIASALAACQADVESALAARDVPYLEARRQTPRPPGRPTASFQTLLALQDAPAPRLALPGCISRQLWMRPASMMFDLVCEAYPAPDRALTLRLTWSGDTVPPDVPANVAETLDKQFDRGSTGSGGPDIRIDDTLA
ncbi:MAG: amino acid adenylation domain-containing protein [Nocardioides sp.]|uniref:amino acid adenylation domain-containing protein n=1 Tax=Nocardioides sp. TaxID=35761 RepID=UPI0039E5B5C4